MDLLGLTKKLREAAKSTIKDKAFGRKAVNDDRSKPAPSRILLVTKSELL
jgi:hypothetical protein